MLRVAPDARVSYLDSCREVIELARSAEGCLDFSLSADLLEPDRINIFEAWTSDELLEAFRGSGPPTEQAAQIMEINVHRYQISSVGPA
jgi:quinol monooxygenase YgiN